MKEIEKRERLPVSVSSAIFIEDGQGRILLLQQAAERKGNRWGPPAGGLEAHEDPIMGARREAKEEIGAEIELIDLIGIYTVDRGNTTSGIGFVFRGKVNSDEIKIKDDEIQDFRFFSPEELRDLVEKELLYKPEYNLQCIKDWMDGQSYPLGVVKPLSK
jgi:8-oxo-dGTP pyrophosphatase MutT (NUDIX family)